jgi:hypothetical protein
VFAAIGKKPPPAPGCVDQQLTSLTLNTNSVHTELDIPPAPAETPYALQILLDMYRAGFLQMVEIMRSPHYRDNVNLQIERDKVSEGLLCCTFGDVYRILVLEGKACVIVSKWCWGLLVWFRL